jgi:hypothetical protein
MGAGGLASHFAATGERHSTMAKTPKGALAEDRQSRPGKLRGQCRPFVLHGAACRCRLRVRQAFQKKSKKAIATSKAEMDLILKDLTDEKEKQ